MSNKKQTAVDWLLNDYVNKGLINIEAIEQAKKIEKQQIKVAFISGEHQQGFQGEAEQYYKETYETSN